MLWFESVTFPQRHNWRLLFDLENLVFLSSESPNFGWWEQMVGVGIPALRIQDREVIQDPIPTQDRGSRSDSGSNPDSQDSGPQRTTVQKQRNKERERNSCALGAVVMSKEVGELSTPMLKKVFGDSKFSFNEWTWLWFFQLRSVFLNILVFQLMRRNICLEDDG